MYRPSIVGCPAAAVSWLLTHASQELLHLPRAGRGPAEKGAYMYIHVTGNQHNFNLAEKSCVGGWKRSNRARRVVSTAHSLK